jgi:putative transposase
VTAADLFRDDDRARAEALFRYRVIGPLLEQDGEGSLRGRVAEIAEATHTDADGVERSVGERTLWLWLRLWRQGGIDALRPRRRKDAGGVRALSPEALARAEALRREVPARWTRIVLDVLRLEGALGESKGPHRSTLDRQLRRRGASRRLLRVLGSPATRKMKLQAFGDLWVGDYHHGPRVLAPDGRRVVAKLGAFIDHATRWPSAHRWYLDEQLWSLRDTLLRALLEWGPPSCIYVDRGAVYRSDQLAYSLAALGVRLVHSRPYYSQGRGVIERWWQLADAFQHEVEALGAPVTIDELNRLWIAFCTRHYLEHVHSELGCTPAAAVAKVVPRPSDPAVLRELFLVRVERTVHIKDACISVEGERFLCDSSLRGRKVDVRYDPADLSSVVVFAEGRRFGRALPQPLNTAVPSPAATAPPPGPKTDYLAMVRADHDRRLLAHVLPVAYSDLGVVPPDFDEAAFLKLLADLSGARVRDAEAADAHAFWATLGPIPEELVRIALEQAVRLRGAGRHVRVYLDVLRTLVLARRKALPPAKEKP